mmetsp:Transcript_9024/g.26984  ORF Transcript_9024/g.26984 Transcript_9024/m.26984 type:complete len:310 (-) Transcript_9024:1175-2104(-)
MAWTCRNWPVKSASLIHRATVINAADWTKTRAVPDTSSLTCHKRLRCNRGGAWSANARSSGAASRSAVGAAADGPAGAAAGWRKDPARKRTRSGSRGSLPGKAARIHSSRAKFRTASIAEESTSGWPLDSSLSPRSHVPTQGSNAPRPRPTSTATNMRAWSSWCLSCVQSDTSTKRAWKSTPEPKPWRSRMHRRKTCCRHPSMPFASHNTIATCDMRTAKMHKTRPAIWSATAVTQRVRQSDTGMGKYTPPMIKPMKAAVCGDNCDSADLAMLYARNTAANIWEKLAEKSAIANKQMAATRGGGAMDSP